jgi:hydroxymethylglutaryl-CoA lyase
MQQQPYHYTECPRDSWQGLGRFIPTEAKISYLLALVEAGFTSLDCAAFVSAKAVPQMQDSESVLAALPELGPNGQRMDYLSIIGNERGLARAQQLERVSSVGFPLSLAASFQQRNLNQSLAEAWALVARLNSQRATKRLVVYLSFAFGNPDNDPWSVAIVLEALQKLQDLDIHDVALADTLGKADAGLIKTVAMAAKTGFPALNIGLHLHARPENALALLDAGLAAGITWFEGALGGVGGCPFAGDALVGNLATEQIWPTLYPAQSLAPMMALAQSAKALQHDYA